MGCVRSEGFGFSRDFQGLPCCSLEQPVEVHKTGKVYEYAELPRVCLFSLDLAVLPGNLGRSFNVREDGNFIPTAQLTPVS